MDKQTQQWRQQRKEELRQSALFKAMNPPDWMGQIAATFYRKVFVQLAKEKRISVGDIEALHIMSELYQDIRDHTDQLRKEGSTYEVNGYIKKHPIADILMQKQRTFKSYCQEFGLTPKSAALSDKKRPHVDAKGDDEEAILEAMLEEDNEFDIF